MSRASVTDSPNAYLHDTELGAQLVATICGACGVRNGGWHKCVGSPKDVMVCLECGKALRNLNFHVFKMHGIRRNEYMRRHNLPLGFRMCSLKTREKLRATAIKSQRGEELKSFRLKPGDRLALARGASKRGLLPVNTIAYWKTNHPHPKCKGCGNPVTRLTGQTYCSRLCRGITMSNCHPGKPAVSRGRCDTCRARDARNKGRAESSGEAARAIR